MIDRTDELPVKRQCEILELSRSGIYYEIIRALQRDGWVMVRTKGSHIRLQKHIMNETLKLTIPAHLPVKRSTLAHILKQARLTFDEFLNLI